MAMHRVVMEVSVYTDEQDGTPEQTAEIWSGIVEETLYEQTAADRVYVRPVDYDDMSEYADHPSVQRAPSD